ncbi:WXG100 family type VII secretion target [Nocardia sp. NPDC058705]|uniref:WXG100 family type VII secretion target n=1 Tax=Nocardia sp. NPDC058705 TaxID=3346609 RepID=UPI0036D0DAA9
MTDDTPAFSVDLDQLDQLTTRMRGYLTAVADVLTALDAKAKEVDDNWSGAVAAAYNEAHTEWRAGVTDMQDGLTALESAAKTAHQSYTEAGTTTLKILGV